MSDDGGPPTKNHDVVEKWADRNWHMLPQSYPNYKMVRRRFQAWCRDEILRRLLTDVANDLRDRGALDEEECIEAVTVWPLGNVARKCRATVFMGWGRLVLTLQRRLTDKSKNPFILSRVIQPLRFWSRFMARIHMSLSQMSATSCRVIHSPSVLCLGAGTHWPWLRDASAMS
jgi:hypothetical protein